MASIKKFTIDGLAKGELVDKKSRFIAQIKHVESEDEGLGFIAAVKKEHAQARHLVLKTGQTCAFVSLMMENHHKPQENQRLKLYSMRTWKTWRAL